MRKSSIPPRKPAADVARPLPGRASTNQAVSRSAERLGSDDDGTMPSGDWMAERQVEAPAPPEGTPVTSEKRDAARRGRARESRRGSY